MSNTQISLDAEDALILFESLILRKGINPLTVEGKKAVRMLSDLWIHLPDEEKTRYIIKPELREKLNIFDIDYSKDIADFGLAKYMEEFGAD